jgi:phage shock protein A
MPCDQCSDALSKGQRFCSNCGNLFTPLSVEYLSAQVAALSAQIAEYNAERNAKEQKYLEFDTAEKVVNRIMSWAKLFGFFVGIPLGVVLIMLGLWAGKSIKDFHDIASAGQASVNATLEKARKDARAAEDLASSAVTTAQTVNHDVQATKDKLSALNAMVKESSSRVEQLNTGVSQQETKLANLSVSLSRR